MWRLREAAALGCAQRGAHVRAASQVFLQRFGIEPMLPNGQRVSTLATEGARERATARRSPFVPRFSRRSRARCNAGGRGVHELRTSWPQLPHDAGTQAHGGSQRL